MNLTWPQWQSLVARCVYKFLLDGTLKAYGVIMEETVTSFHAQHYLVGCAFALQTGIGYLIAPLTSVFDGKVHPWIVATIGGFLAGLGFIGRAALPTSKDLWQLFACLFLSGVGFGLVNVITVISLKEAFASSYATAYSVTLLPTYLGIAVMPPLLEYLQRKYGDNTGMVVFGILSWSLMLTGLFTPRNITGNNDVEMTDVSKTDKRDDNGSLNKTPEIEDYTEESTLLQNAATTDDRQTGSSDNRNSGETADNIYEKKGLKAWVLIAKNHPECLLLLFITVLVDHGFTSWSIFLVPYGEYLGLDSETAVWLSTVGGIVGLVGRLFCVVLFYINRMNIFLGLLMPIMCVISAYIISLFTSSFSVSVAIVSSLSGFGLSVQACVVASWIPYCVCDFNFKTALYGFYVLSGIMTLMGGITTGAIVDITGSYRIAFTSLAILSLFQAIATAFWMICPAVSSPEKSMSDGRNTDSTTCCSGS